MMVTDRFYKLHLIDGRIVDRHAWTGGDTPPKRFADARFCEIRRIYFRELVGLSGGLGFWECADTTALERARIFWNQATLNAWRTYRRNFNQED